MLEPTMNDKLKDSINKRILEMKRRVEADSERDFSFYNRPIEDVSGGSKVVIAGQEMGMFASYSYLGLIGHPRIAKAAKRAVDEFGTGTHGVRLLAGTLPVHRELENTIAEFKNAEAAITFSSGYVTNLTVISTLLGRGDFVISDKLNHASIVDGCTISNAKFLRFRHNDMADLERRLESLPLSAGKLVVVDAVFSMDGDIIDLPRVSELCKKHGAWLMVDEAHSVGVLGETGRGVEEHFGLSDAVDIKMGTLSKAIPASGGYIAGSKDLINYLRYSARAYIFSAALTPPQAAAANEAFKVIVDEPWRVDRLRQNFRLFRDGIRDAGLDTLSATAGIVPVICGTDDQAYQVTRLCQRAGVFVLPVLFPAVPPGLSRLRATVMATHKEQSIKEAINVIAESSGKVLSSPLGSV
ncbi:aminotransferase class I/II-fold pyridoxal phosphate-dependent enzyme [Amycolatopsis sp. NPDC049868]|uniref:aminotransferase class I/II-fold pyridoxal phosphate-dependent enzyme n=1 Tax=Amycolatopsis sp. NPDC049868 TaxID=3363934 RepID=UPI0037B330D9